MYECWLHACTLRPIYTCYTLTGTSRPLAPSCAMFDIGIMDINISRGSSVHFNGIQLDFNVRGYYTHE